MAEGSFVVAADDGEGVEDVGGVFAGEAVEVEVEGIEAGAQVAALFFVPDEGRAFVAEVTYSIMPSRSKTRRTSSKLASIFPFGNRICPNP